MHRMPDYETITPTELKKRLEIGERPELLDVREPWEFELARIEGSKLIPLSDLPDRFTELDPSAETVVICHHGSRRRGRVRPEVLPAPLSSRYAPLTTSSIRR